MQALSEKPIFVTENGVNMYNGMTCYTEKHETVAVYGIYDYTTEPYFSTEQAAKDYIASKEKACTPKLITQEGKVLVGNAKCYLVNNNFSELTFCY